MQDTYTIIVNSSDGFDDCWYPFFKLLSSYWPDLKAPIILNTEHKGWSYPGLDIHCSKVQDSSKNRKMTWSECLLDVLKQVRTPLVLYFQEDYFLERRVNGSLINELAEMMMAKRDIKHIGLTHFGSAGPFEPTEDMRLWKISQKSPYRIATQAGLWEVETLRSYLRPEENGWMFEIYGTKRAQRRKDTFLTVNREMYHPGAAPIIQYTHTGIIKGKWHPDMPALFKAHGIEMDFSSRGFYQHKPRVLEKLITFRKLISNPVALYKGLTHS